MTGSEYGKKTGQHDQPTQQSQMFNYCDCGDYCALCHPELCDPMDLDQKRCEICGAYFSGSECPECYQTDWARDERARAEVGGAAEDAAREEI